MKAQIVSFRCVLSDKLGKVISSTFNRDVMTCSKGEGQLLKGLADGLLNLKNGERRRISLTAEQAYGFYKPALVVDVSRRRLFQGSALQLGDTVDRRTSNGKVLVFHVVAVFPEYVTLDGNHPLAGQDLVFDIETLEAREANAEEIAESGGPAAPSEYLPSYTVH